MIISREASKRALILLCIVIFTTSSGGSVFAGRYFLIERPGLGLEFSYKFEKDERKSADVNREDTAAAFSERLDIETEGWVYHPALMTYTLRLAPEWKQLSERTDGEDKRASRSFLRGYFTELTFLQYKPYTLNIFADKQRSTLTSAFAARSETDTDSYGAGLMLKYEALPTNLTYRHLESAQTGFYTADNEADEIFLNMRHDKHLGDTSLNASYKDSARTAQGVSVNTVAQNVTLQNYYNLTEDRRVALASGLGYRASHGDFTESTSYNLSEALNWRHRENLSTNYTARYDKNTTEASVTESKALGFDLTHLLYENLTTSLNTLGALSDFTGGRTGNYGAAVNFNYVRAIPWGTLNINAGYDYKITDQDIISDFIQVTDESVTLTDGVVTLLENERVDIDSIVITDNTGAIGYIKDIDYRVTGTDSFVRISRITGGGISSGQEVLVDYGYLSNPAFNYSTFSQSYGVNLNLRSAWRLFYRFNSAREEFISGLPPDELTDDTVHSAGTELEWKWSRTRLDFEDRRTTIMPTTRRQAEETVTLKPGEKLFFSISGNYGETEFKDTGEVEKSNGLRGTIQMAASKWSRLRLEGFRNKLSGQVQQTTDSGFSSTLEWFSGIWRGSISYRLLNAEDETANETFRNNYFLFEIKRTLF
ncbi:MAG: TonB-dependent receptor [Nitrospirae bacterium]|nr:TonB-dependent receptor [Nitrospirota bacterium]